MTVLLWILLVKTFALSISVESRSSLGVCLSPVINQWGQTRLIFYFLIRLLFAELSSVGRVKKLSIVAC